MSLKVFSALALAFVFNTACGRDSQENSLGSAVSATLPACQLSENCSQTLPELPRPQGFGDIYKKLLTKLGKPLHRGRDVIVVSGEPIWIQAKFAYGILDADLHEEPIDIYLSQGCNQRLRKIGQGFTTLDGEHIPVNGVEDTGGRIFVNLANLGINTLPIGRHRVVLVVPGDNTFTELYITVIDPRQQIAVSDIDGTLAQGEAAAVANALGSNPAANPGAAAAIRALAQKGYHIFYLTARSEWLMADTREWLKSHGFPQGTLRTTTSKIGAPGPNAAEFKRNELEVLKYQTGITPSIAVGNKASDVVAFSEAGIPGQGSFYYKLNSDLAGGLSFADYFDLGAAIQTSAKVCR